MTDDTDDDGAPIDTLEQYFEARGWVHERSGDGEIVASAGGSWAQYELRGVWRPEDQVLQFLAFPDVKVASEKRASGAVASTTSSAIARPTSGPCLNPWPEPPPSR